MKKKNIRMTMMRIIPDTPKVYKKTRRSKSLKKASSFLLTTENQK